MFFKNLEFRIYHLNEIESTNIHAHKLIQENKAKKGDVFYADLQTIGRGQRGTKWQSDEASNLLMSVVLQPSFKANQQFLLSQTIALAVYYYLDNLTVGKVRIKWPNDILVNQQKIAGVLIENTLQGENIQYSIVGIGLNINQMVFEKFSRKATSLQLLSGKSFNVKQQLEKLLESIEYYYDFLNPIAIRSKEYSQIQIDYLQKNYGYHEELTFRDKNGTFRGKVVGFEPDGKLIVESKGEKKAYDLKEIQFIN